MRKILFYITVSVLLLAVVTSLYLYKIKHGFPVDFETDEPNIHFPSDRPALLVFSKSTGYRHSESITAAKAAFVQMGSRNDWSVYETEEGGVFNERQLRQFSAVILNNSTGRVLNQRQKQAVEQYVHSGGTLLGIHGAGDFSHSDWPWLEANLIGAAFSHHPMHPPLQSARVRVERHVDSMLTSGLPGYWTSTDEWYIYYSQPKNMHIIAYIDGEKILPSGNVLYFGNKDFGMGKQHPVAWYRPVDQGRTFYTSMGHTADVWRNPQFLTLLENAVLWSVKRSDL